MHSGDRADYVRGIVLYLVSFLQIYIYCIVYIYAWLVIVLLNILGDHVLIMVHLTDTGSRKWSNCAPLILQYYFDN